MRKFVYPILTLLALMPAAATAQETAEPVAVQQAAHAVKFGYLSYETALKAMSGYAVARNNLASLKAQYEAEAKRSEDEFNDKYQAFIDVQSQLDGPILRKRQAELQELLTKNVEFKAEARRLLKQAESDAYAPLRAQLDGLLAKIGRERGYAFILNSDAHSLPYVSPACGEDITAMVAEIAKTLPAPRSDAK